MVHRAALKVNSVATCLLGELLAVNRHSLLIQVSAVKILPGENKRLGVCKKMVGKQVMLKTFVKVEKDWRNNLRDLNAFGYKPE
jgi:hypothetical protein